ncbi:MAG: M28 family peptidase [Actinomycetota bacterium]
MDKDSLSTVNRSPLIWLLSGYTDLVTGFFKRRKEARDLAGGLPDIRADVPHPDSQTIFRWIEELCSTPHRRPGTPEGRRGEEYVAGKLEEFGLERITMEPIPINVWEARSWGLQVGEEGRKVDVPCFRVTNTAFTPKEGVTAPLVYVGRGMLPASLWRKEVRGKIVVAEVPFPTLPVGFLLKALGGGYYLSDPEGSITPSSRLKLVFVRPNFMGQFLDVELENMRLPLQEMRLPWDVYWNAVKQGAQGVVLILTNMVGSSDTHCGPYDACLKPIPAVWVGKDKGHLVRAAAERGEEATLVLEGEARKGITRNVWGLLPGSTEDTIIIQSHHDSPFLGATEDGCGVGQVLAQAKAWAQVPREERPKTLLFLLAAAHFYGPALGAYSFAREHAADILKRTDAVICLEHLGAKQVVEKEGEMVPLDGLAETWVFTSPNRYIAASLIKTLRRHRLKRTIAIPHNFLAPVPPTDAFPYPLMGVDFLSWISQPYYLLSAEDTLDKVSVEDLEPIAAAVTDLVKTLMALDSRKIRP